MKLKLVITFCVLVVVFFGCESQKKQDNEVHDSSISIPFDFTEIRFDNKELLQMAVDVASHKVLDSLDKYEFVRCILSSKDSVLVFKVNRSYRDSMQKIENYESIIDLETYFLMRLNGGLIADLNEVQQFVLYRDENIDKSLPVKKDDTRFIDVSINYVKTCDKKYFKWLSAINAFCSTNPSYPTYDSLIYEKITSFCTAQP